MIRSLFGMLLATSLAACSMPGSPPTGHAAPVHLLVAGQPAPLAGEPNVELASSKQSIYVSVVPGGAGYSLYLSLLADQSLTEGFQTAALRAVVLELNRPDDNRLLSWRTSPDTNGIDGLALESTRGRLKGQFTATLQPLPGNPQGPQTVTLRFDTPYPSVRDPQAEP